MVVLYNRDVLEQSLGRKVGVLYADGSTLSCRCRGKEVKKQQVVVLAPECVLPGTDSARTILVSCAFYEEPLKGQRV
jgi:hypothetical protein